ncbi:uncharacterized protein [Pleurodeles waltl]|uniref:uncharacterized protein n=1 Tax=Pleurodeles waltl TaxID=8319 RepID=UPI0037096E75
MASLVTLAGATNEERGARRDPGGSAEPEVWQIFIPVLSLSPSVLSTQRDLGAPGPRSAPGSRTLGARGWHRDSSDDLEIWFKDYCCCGLPMWYCPGDHRCDCPEDTDSHQSEFQSASRHYGSELRRVRHDSSRSSGVQQVMSDHIREALGRWRQDVDHCCEESCCCKGLEYCCKFYCECGVLRWYCDIHRYEGLDLLERGMWNCRTDSPKSQGTSQCSRSDVCHQNDLSSPHELLTSPSGLLCRDGDQMCIQRCPVSNNCSPKQDFRRSPCNQCTSSCKPRQSLRNQSHSPHNSSCSYNKSPHSHESPSRGYESPQSQRESPTAHSESPNNHMMPQCNWRGPHCSPAQPQSLCINRESSSSGHSEASPSSSPGGPRFG